MSGSSKSWCAAPLLGSFMKSVSGTLGVCELGHFSSYHSLFSKAEHNAAGT